MSNKKVQGNHSKFPIVAIIVVLALTFVGVWWINSNPPSQRTATNSGTNTPTQNSQGPNQALLNAPKGATPPNFLGSETAPVVIEEFADYQCPSCATVAPILKEITSIYGNRIKFVFRNFPLVNIHDKAYDAAVAAEAAGLQDKNKFWEMQNQIFKNQAVWARSAEHKTLFEEYAKLIGLDIERFKADSAGIIAKSRVDADLQRSRDSGISSTPTVFINNVAVPYDKMTVPGLQELINAELGKFTAGPK